MAVVSLIEHARGNQSTAVRLIEEIEEVTRDRPVFRARHLPEALRVCVAAGAIRLGERLLDTSGHAAARHRHSVLAGRAVLTEARGRQEEASALYAEAAERWADYGFALERGQAALGAGRCLVALGRPPRGGRPTWTRLGRTFDALRAGPLLADADRVAGAAKARPRRWPKSAASSPCCSQT